MNLHWLTYFRKAANLDSRSLFGAAFTADKIKRINNKNWKINTENLVQNSN